MKSVILLLCIALAVSSASIIPKIVLPSQFVAKRDVQQNPTCTTRNKNVGEACTISNGESNCLEGLACRSGKCYYSAPGSNCTSDNDCQGYGADTCINGKCDYHRIAAEPCSTNAQCLSNQCGNDNKCAHKGFNETCTGGDCARGLYCSPDGYCQAALPEGENCAQIAYAIVTSGRSDSANSADYSALCYQSFCDFGVSSGVPVGTCKRVLSVPAGQACANSFVCATPLKCSASPGLVGVCEAEVGDSCNDVETCAGIINNCICANTTTGTCQASCGDQIKTVLDCVLANNCTALGAAALGHPDACASVCNSQFTTAFCCEKSARDIYSPPGLTCPGSFGNQLVVATVFVAFLALASAFMF